MNDMPIDGKILKVARERLEAIKAEYEQANLDRKSIAFAAVPRLNELVVEQADIVRRLYSGAFGITRGDAAELTAERDAIRSEIRRELISHGFPDSYLETRYHCDKCSDLGYIGTKMCSCLEEIYKEERAREHSELLKLSDETFDAFELSYYPDVKEKDSPFSPRQSMELVFNFCKSYAEKFSDNSKNLFFTGGTGLGKTFLSACIAKVVAKKGYSVIYDTAHNIFSEFEAEKFGRAGVSESGRYPSERFFRCDLLILDDLGTEMTTSFTVSALYNIINLRLLYGKPTIISSNLFPDSEKDEDEFQRRYSQQISSRIKGEYEIVKFQGNDIRRLKKNK